jgi:hypothetical protein
VKGQDKLKLEELRAYPRFFLLSLNINRSIRLQMLQEILCVVPVAEKRKQVQLNFEIFYILTDHLKSKG